MSLNPNIPSSGYWLLNCRVCKYPFQYPHKYDQDAIYICPKCSKKAIAYMPDKISENSPLQLPLGFKVPGPKTLKPEADSSKPLGTLVENAQSWLNSQDQYTKVEFKYGRNYIVIAKLKD